MIKLDIYNILILKIGTVMSVTGSKTIQNCCVAISYLKTDVEIDPVIQNLKLFHSGDQEYNGVSLAGRTAPINLQDVEKGQIVHLQTSVETMDVNIVNPLTVIQSGPGDDKRLALFKKYPEYFSGVDKNRSVEKAKEFYDLNASKFVFDDKCSQEFIKKTKEEVLEICQWGAGRELFAKMFEYYPNLKYMQYCRNSCSPSKQLVQLCPEEQYYYTYINENNEQALHFSPGWITHVHELIHLYKDAVDEDGRDDVFCEPSIDQTFHSLEEERVITGFPELNFQRVNENLFHYLAGSPYRSSHGGVLVSQADHPLSAVDCVNADALGSLKKIKCNINAPQKIKEKNVHPLNLACYLNNKKMADYLIKNGADINVIDDYGSPLHACINAPWKGENSHALLRLLIESGIDVNGKDQGNLTPFILALNSNQLDATQILIESGADINCENGFGETPLMEACRTNNINNFELLMRGKADINYEHKRGERPLMIALDYGNWDIAKRLIEAGADVNHINKNDETPLTRARAREAPQDVMDLLSINGVL
jgi:hypothetical protein